MDYGIFNVRTDINACDCTRGCTDTVRESALKVDFGRKKNLAHRRIEPTSAACRSDALTTELHPRPKGTSDTQRLATALVSVSRCGLVVRRLAGKQKDLGSIRFGPPFCSKTVVYGHSLVTLPHNK